MFNLIPIILGFYFQMNFTSKLKLQIWVMLRLIYMVHFLQKSHMNGKEFGATSCFTRIHYGLISAPQNSKLNAKPPKQHVHTNPPQDRPRCIHDEFNLRQKYLSHYFFRKQEYIMHPQPTNYK